MGWPSWDQAAVAAVLLAALAVATRASQRRPIRWTSALAQETALIAFLYMVWRLARQLPLSQEEGAYDRALWLWDVQRWMHLPSELTMERFALEHPIVAELTVWYYATLHVPSLIAFLVWLWVRHPGDYPRWRNVLAITTGFCLFIRFIRVAPPRLLPELGFVDLPAELGRNIYGPVGTGASDQFAAMPSIHVAWAVIVGLGVFSVSKRWWRWVGPLHIAATFWAVMATANHWWLDGLVAVALVGVALAIDDGVRRRFAGADSRGRAPAPEPPPELVVSGAPPPRAVR